MKTPKRTHAREVGEKMAHYWTLTNYTRRERGDKEYPLEWMLADAWLKGFEAGRRDEKQRQKEKAKE
jgi:hypothetical protein